MSIIIVNSTAARTSGALTILKQFISALPTNDTQNEYYIFINPQVKLKQVKNVHYIPIDTVSWAKRIYWDEIGLRKWMKKHKLIPDLFISFQNTGVKLDSNISQLIYYHQLLPLTDHKWNVLKKDGFTLFLYQKFYAFFVSRYLTPQSHIVVQIPSIKKAFCEKFNFLKEKISVIRPDTDTIDYKEIKDYLFNDRFLHFIYPATPFIYKNHIDIIKAMGILKDRGKVSNIKIHFTFNKNEAPNLLNAILKLNMEDNFIFEGSLPYKQLLSLYKSATALLFPSYIETFGLPLVEAANAGLPIIAMDLPYARDVIGKYEGAKFIPLHDTEALADAISDIIWHPKRFTPLAQENENNWNLFFQLIDKLKI